MDLQPARERLIESVMLSARHMDPSSAAEPRPHTGAPGGRAGGQEMAKARGRIFQPAKAGEYVSGILIGSTNLASGRYAMIGDGLGLVPGQPVLDQRIGRHITGIMRGDGGIEWISAGSSGWDREGVAP
jgi:hypothetical protein